MSIHALTARIAFLLFEHRGRAPGHHLQDWFAAESIVHMCLAVFEAQRPEGAAPAQAVPAASVPAARKRAREGSARKTGRARPADARTERDVLALLEAAVAEQGRAGVAAALGYASTRTIAKVLRGDRVVSRDLAQRVLEAFTAAGGDAAAKAEETTSPQPQLKLLEGREAA